MLSAKQRYHNLPLWCHAQVGLRSNTLIENCKLNASLPIPGYVESNAMTSALNKTTEIFPRHNMIENPTPLTRLNRLSEHFDIDLWIKRDDLAGPTLGGNKTRQLEYYFGAALAKGADTILITGAVQSNFVRIAAAIAAALGMEVVLPRRRRRRAR